MAQRAEFWTYRAGTRVFTGDGRTVGRVSAVRRDAVLVTSSAGDSTWIPGGQVIHYDGTRLTIAPLMTLRASGAWVGTTRTIDRLLPEITLTSNAPTRWDA